MAEPFLNSNHIFVIKMHTKFVFHFSLLVALAYFPQSIAQEVDATAELSNTSAVPQSGRHRSMVPTDRAIEIFERRIDANNRDFSSRLVLGQLLLRRAKENDCFGDYLLAEKQFRDAMLHETDHVNAKALLAKSLLDQHRFREAEKVASSVLEIVPNNFAALATCGDANMQFGKYNEAKHYYDQMRTAHETPPFLVRIASYYDVTGKTDEAIETMKAAVELQMKQGSLPEANAWYIWRLGKVLFDQGKTIEAKSQFEKALELNPEYTQAMTMLAKIESFGDDKDSAIALYRRAASISKEPPTLVALADLLTVLNRNWEAKPFYERAELLMNEEEKDPAAGPAHARERAMYLANHEKRLPHALKLATDDLIVRNDIFTHDVAAWAYYQNGNFEKAKFHSDKALQHNTKNASIIYHAGLIEIANQNQIKGMELLISAKRLNPYFCLKGMKKINQVLGQTSE